MREALTQLDFNEDPPESLMEAVSRILRHFGDDGATSEDLAGMFQRNITQYKVQSMSPALTGLVKIGCAKTESRFGTRRWYYLKAFTNAEREQLNLIQRNEKEQRIVERAKQLKLDAPAPSTPVLGKDAAVAVSKTKMMFAIGERDTIVLEPKAARELYEQLKAVFG